MNKESILANIIDDIAVENNSMSGWTENEDVDYYELVIYADEQKQLDSRLKLHHKNTGELIEYQILEIFTDGNRDECILLKCK